MDVFLKCKSFTSAEVALSCCSALGVEVVISFTWGAETAEKILLFFFLSSTSLYQTYGAQNLHPVITIHSTS